MDRKSGTALKRASKWLLPVLVLAEALLVWFELLDFGDAMLVVAGLEALLLFLVLGEVLLVVRRYRRGRAVGLGFWAALEDGPALIMPRPMAKLAVSELRMFGCLFRWILGRTRPKGGEFGYHKKSRTIFIVVLVLLTSPVELLVLELIIPWAWLQLVLLALGIYTVFWFLGFHASLAALPHRLEAHALRLRHGLLAEARIPYAAISSVKVANRRSPKGGEGLHSSPEENAVYLAINGKTNVTLELRAPQTASGFLREIGPSSTFHLWADEPKALVRELKERLRESPPPVVIASDTPKDATGQRRPI